MHCYCHWWLTIFRCFRLIFEIAHEIAWYAPIDKPNNAKWPGNEMFKTFAQLIEWSNCTQSQHVTRILLIDLLVSFAFERINVRAYSRPLAAQTIQIECEQNSQTLTNFDYILLMHNRRRTWFLLKSRSTCASRLRLLLFISLCSFCSFCSLISVYMQNVSANSGSSVKTFITASNGCTVFACLDIFTINRLSHI